ncbi:DUF826 domain-containing protein [Escherichia coli]|nr:DUF826 domain-containing protein [Escherichia coli]EHM4561312.1 DUF826 domain-containing protein [Escherichia coli]EJQ8079238.1 DUF826 domain-containing protein [Escherichia coli]HAZ3577517.1 DUF826 domain-containing protein [Escherichia coli]HBA7950907.1 DUF826 domain-containing protein [Escherichia coli]
MAEEKAAVTTAVTGLVTDEVLKQALASREVLNPLKGAVKKLLSEQIDAAVESALVSLTGEVVDTARDEDGEAAKEIDTGGSADTEETTDETAGEQGTGDIVEAATANAGTQTAEVKATTTAQAQSAAPQAQKQA